MTGSGWIKLHRSLLDWEWYDDINTFRLFIHCLLRANHSDAMWHGLTIKRGSFLTSLESLRKETGLTVSQVRTSISKLEMTSSVTSKSQARHRVITVLEYDRWQDNDKLSDSEIARWSQDNRKIVATNKNEKKKKKKKNEKNTNSAALDFSVWPSQPSEQTLTDWLTMRIKSKAEVTQTVVNRMAKKLHAAALQGFTVEECLSECVLRGWRGFDVSWLSNSTKNDSGFSQGATRTIDNLNNLELS